jgi:hypothetical protein
MSLFFIVYAAVFVVGTPVSRRLTATRNQGKTVFNGSAGLCIAAVWLGQLRLGVSHFLVSVARTVMTWSPT